MTRLLFAAVVCCSVGCGDDEPDLSAAEAESVFFAGNDEIHTFHVDAFANGFAVVEGVSWPCPEGGAITMDTADRDTEVDLFHQFDDCGVGGYVLSGTIDYVAVTECDGGGFNIPITGQLDVTGDAATTNCTIDVLEDCDASYEGRVCGRTLSVPAPTSL